jgi:hypothetical protein
LRGLKGTISGRNALETSVSLENVSDQNFLISEMSKSVQKCSLSAWVLSVDQAFDFVTSFFRFDRYSQPQAIFDTICSLMEKRLTPRPRWKEDESGRDSQIPSNNNRS